MSRDDAYGGGDVSFVGAIRPVNIWQTMCARCAGMSQWSSCKSMAGSRQMRRITEKLTQLRIVNQWELSKAQILSTVRSSVQVGDTEVYFACHSTRKIRDHWRGCGGANV